MKRKKRDGLESALIVGTLVTGLAGIIVGGLVVLGVVWLVQHL